MVLKRLEKAVLALQKICEWGGRRRKKLPKALGRSEKCAARADFSAISSVPRADDSLRTVSYSAPPACAEKKTPNKLPFCATERPREAP